VFVDRGRAQVFSERAQLTIPDADRSRFA